tara:strand:- start:69 stop:1334 length:1266 start_codon:yes stop_codon:yes gene_type:complete
MDKIEILGGKPLVGKICISGAKNAALPILAASLLTNSKLELSNIPKLSDINSMIRLLKSLNSHILNKSGKVIIKSRKPKHNFASYDLVRKMRASFLVLGPLLSRYGEAKVSLPGGCAIGARPIDIHLTGFEKMGVNFEIKNGYVIGKVKKNLKGAKICLPFKSVGATENLLMAATLAEGKTIIVNAAQEPEIVDLGECLKLMGAKVHGLGTSKIIVNGVKKMTGCNYKIMPDRIEAGTYLLAVLGCSGWIELDNLNNEVIQNLINTFDQFKDLDLVKKDDTSISVKFCKKTYDGISIKTSPFPGFPTDLQAQLSAVMTRAKGISIIEESIFENRFMHVAELQRMGASILIEGSKVIIKGKKKIFGAQLMATDLRASSSLIIAGLMAEGKTIINRVYHLDRGYEKIEKKLSKCNVNIKRIKG